jgi:hypothetical protein
MHIEFLYWSGCPSHESAMTELRQVMADLEIGPDALSIQQVETEDDAVAACFPGSPTVRIDGIDVQSSDERPQLTCRVYRRRDGRVSPTPDPADLRDALAEAQATGSKRTQ